MPWKIAKVKGGWNVIKGTTGKKKNKTPFKSKEKAEVYLKALYANTKD